MEIKVGTKLRHLGSGELHEVTAIKGNGLIETYNKKSRCGLLFFRTYLCEFEIIN